MADVSCDRGAIPESCCTKGLKRKAQVVDEFVRCDQLGCASRRPTIQSRMEGVLRMVNVVVLFVVDEDAAEVVAVSNMADAAMDAVAVVTDEAIDVIVSVVSVAAEDDVDDGTADC
ncbi:hypothetical protein PF005_g29049 [Phytophthora fragariae]|uniref:Uncharacterized protein n=1 Tax=Phytophthora fragariae TaxID=53985 RepID=A0A6A3VII1_9STRA|nr:hypothetical protein PF010_g29068 [Phytophthora fragariae]KAE9064709.1 hypothetical protein PF007_g29095 [Phytophthora fragariae]KAE9166801.1 hypothetical protein PF005_g29049 [Phytophthora fragariae]KAE9170142.1 hypothetical protein PF002_g30172 [Phytophthora fragariae]